MTRRLARWPLPVAVVLALLLQAVLAAPCAAHGWKTHVSKTKTVTVTTATTTTTKTSGAIAPVAVQPVADRWRGSPVAPMAYVPAAYAPAPVAPMAYVPAAYAPGPRRADGLRSPRLMRRPPSLPMAYVPAALRRPRVPAACVPAAYAPAPVAPVAPVAAQPVAPQAPTPQASGQR